MRFVPSLRAVSMVNAHACYNAFTGPNDFVRMKSCCLCLASHSQIWLHLATNVKVTRKRAFV